MSCLLVLFRLCAGREGAGHIATVGAAACFCGGARSSSQGASVCLREYRVAGKAKRIITLLGLIPAFSS
jgi:hypothetical protein